MDPRGAEEYRSIDECEALIPLADLGPMLSQPTQHSTVPPGLIKSPHSSHPLFHASVPSFVAIKGVKSLLETVFGAGTVCLLPSALKDKLEAKCSGLPCAKPLPEPPRLPASKQDKGTTGVALLARFLGSFVRKCVFRA